MKQLLAATIMAFAATAATADTQPVSDYWMDKLTLHDVVMIDEEFPNYQTYIMNNFNSAEDAGSWRMEKLKNAYLFNILEYPGDDEIFNPQEAPDIPEEIQELGGTIMHVIELDDDWVFERVLGNNFTGEVGSGGMIYHFLGNDGTYRHWYFPDEWITDVSYYQNEEVDFWHMSHYANVGSSSTDAKYKIYEDGEWIGDNISDLWEEYEN